MDPNGVAYLDLLKRTLTREIVGRPYERHTWRAGFPVKRELVAVAKRIASAFALEIVRRTKIRADAYTESGDAAKNRAEDAESMVGTLQFDNMQACIVDVVENQVPGDVLEAGVWRGGMSIFMRGVLNAMGAKDRTVWACDSFEGLPETSGADSSAKWFEQGDMAVSLEEVEANFRRYGLLGGTAFIKGFFDKTLPGPVERIAILRMDADLHDSTRDVLNALYPKLSTGGWLICDDYQNIPGCQKAVDDYRKLHGITEPIHTIDKRAICWKKVARAA